MDWKRNFNKKKQTTRPRRWVNDVEEAVAFLKEVGVDHFETRGDGQIAVEAATEEQLKQILKRLNCFIRSKEIAI